MRETGEKWDRNRCRVIPFHHVPEFEEEYILSINEFRFERKFDCQVKGMINFPFFFFFFDKTCYKNMTPVTW